MKDNTHVKEHDFPNIGMPATNAFLNAGISRMDQFPTYTKKELLSLHGVGPKAIRILEETLKENGLSFKQ